MSRLCVGLVLFPLYVVTVVAADIPHDKPLDPTEAQWFKENRHTVETLSIDRLNQSIEAPGNRYVRHPKAIELGQKLFFDRRLSRNGQVSCASCHQPGSFFSDGLPQARGVKAGQRNTPSLLGVAHNTWFFWDGRKDSLWSQTLAPLEDPHEHALTRTEIIRFVGVLPEYQALLTALTTHMPPKPLYALPHQAMPSGNIEQIRAWKQLDTQKRQQIDQIFAVLGKALAAYVTTLQPVRQPLDDYIAYLQQAHTAPPKPHQKPDLNSNPLGSDAIQGLRLFMGKAACINCHSGPLMTNQGFHNIGTGQVGDSGRAAVLDEVRLDRFNCLGAFSDAHEGQCLELKYMQRDRHHLWGAFKTPPLRNVARTAPYFHDGRMKTLEAVIEHYLQTNLTEGTDLPAIQLTKQEQQQLLAFLQTLQQQK